ncbi:hypothetical protein ACTXT7_006774 [Hymenolepis weldensis]
MHGESSPGLLPALMYAKGAKFCGRKLVQFKCDGKQTISMPTTEFFDDVTLRTVITLYLAVP